METAELRRRVDGLASEPDRLRRRLLALGALTARLAPEGIEPILVGGCALALYTDGGYSTEDVDLALPHGPATDRAFSDLGFRKRGRFWARTDLDLLFEAPAPAGLPGETAPRTELELDGLRIVVLGVEDLLIDRLRAWVHWKSDEDGRWAARLVALYGKRMDWTYLRSKVEADAGEQGALARLEGGTT
jgi:hypothetical protein